MEIVETNFGVWKWWWEMAPQLTVVPPRAGGNESVEDAILDIVAAGRKKYVKPCVLVEEPACPANRDAHARLYEDQEDDAAPATILVPSYCPEDGDDGDYPF